MKNIKNQFLKYTFLGILALLSTSVYGQFNTRFALEISAGTTHPLNFAENIDPDGIPYMYQNFDWGNNLSAGIYYRLNRRMSVGLVASQNLHWTWTDPATLEDEYAEFGREFNYQGFQPFFQIIKIGSNFRYEIAPDARISPFLMAGTGGYTYLGEIPPKIDIIDHDPESLLGILDEDGTSEYIYEIKTVLRTNAVVVEPTTQIGLNAGAGIDFALSNYFSVILQANYNRIFTTKNNNLRLDTQYVTANIGLRMNVFKRRSIL